MPGRHRRHSWRTWGTLALGLASLHLAGCASLSHRQTPPEHVQRCEAIPCDSRSHVYTFLINGNDPLRYGDFISVQRDLFALGYPKTWYGELYHMGSFEREIKQVCREDQEAKIVLVGFSYGAMQAQRLARTLARQGIHAERLVMLDPFGIDTHPDTPGGFHGRTVNLRSETLWHEAPYVDQADNVNLAEKGHFNVPTHPHTLQLLVEELCGVAQTVPSYGPTTCAVFEPGPVPRATSPALPPTPPEWNLHTPMSPTVMTHSTSYRR